MLQTTNPSYQNNVVGHVGAKGATSAKIAFSFPTRYAEAYMAELDYVIDYSLGGSFLQICVVLVGFVVRGS